MESSWSLSSSLLACPGMARNSKTPPPTLLPRRPGSVSMIFNPCRGCKSWNLSASTNTSDWRASFTAAMASISMTRVRSIGRPTAENVPNSELTTKWCWAPSFTTSSWTTWCGPLSQAGESSPAAEKREGTSQPSGPGDGDERYSRSLGTEQATRSAQTRAHSRQRAEAYRDRACSGVCTVGSMSFRLLECEHSFPTFHIDDCPSFEIGLIEGLV